MKKPNPHTEIDVRFVRKRHNNAAICVKDGRTEKSPFTGKSRPVETWVPTKLIANIDDFVLVELDANEPMTLRIPEWFAIEVGFV